MFTTTLNIKWAPNIMTPEELPTCLTLSTGMLQHQAQRCQPPPGTSLGQNGFVLSGFVKVFSTEAHQETETSKPTHRNTVTCVYILICNIHSVTWKNRLRLYSDRQIKAIILMSLQDKGPCPHLWPLGFKAIFFQEIYFNFLYIFSNQTFC